MIDEFSIRPIKPADLNRLKEIINASFSRFLRYFAQHSIKTEEITFVVVTQKEVVVGFAKPIKFKIGDASFGCILWVAVHPQFRLKGLASMLVKASVDFLKNEGAKTIFASVQKRNASSLAVFNKQGFRRMSFSELWRLFNWRIFEFFGDIWLAPGEVVLMHD